MMHRVGVWLLFTIYGWQAYLFSNGYGMAAYVVQFLPYMFLVAYGWVALRKKLELPHNDESRKFRTFAYVVALLFLLASFRAHGFVYYSYLRAIIFTLNFVVYALFLHQYVRLMHRSARGDRIWSDLLVSLLLVLGLNYVLLFVFGIESAQAKVYIESLDSNLGLLAKRIFFPLTPNAREYSQCLGLITILGLAVHGYSSRGYGVGRRKLFQSLLMMALGLFTIALLDARMSLILTILVSFVMMWMIRRNGTWTITRTIIILFVSFPAFYFLMLAVFGFVLDIESPMTLSGRIFIWAIAFTEYGKLSAFAMLFGSGMYSHATLGLSKIFGVLFVNWTNSIFTTFHNATIQNVYDIGIVGTFLFVLYQWKMGKVLRIAPDSEFDAASRWRRIVPLTVMLYYLTLWSTEPTTPLYFLSYILILALLYSYVSVVILRGENN